MNKQFKELVVETDCGDVRVEEYDDGIANGIRIYLGDTVVAAVDCYRKTKLPTQHVFDKVDFDLDEDLEEQVLNALSDGFGYCVNSCRFTIDGCYIVVTDIDWDQDLPEARLLVYGPEGHDNDEPQDCIVLN